jgi:acetolactate synthase-1/2/3 large subunit
VPQVLYEETRGEAVVTTGVGQHQMWAAQFYKFREPRRWVTSGGLGSMGFGLPSGEAAALLPVDLMQGVRAMRSRLTA